MAYYFRKEVVFMKSSIPTDVERVSLLSIPQTGAIDVVLDTDAYNEVDDQFAIVYALRSAPRINLLSLYAAPFVNICETMRETKTSSIGTQPHSVTAREGMELSYLELIHLLEMMSLKPEGFAYRGVNRFLRSETDFVDCPAVEDLIAKAQAHSPEHPLYVVGIAAPTNIASAIVRRPDLLCNMVVVWQGGNALWWPHTDDYNLKQDIHASRVLLNSGVALCQMPAMGGSHQLTTCVAELEACLGGGGPVARYLTDNVHRWADKQVDPYAYTKAIWDVGVFGMLNCMSWTPSYLASTPVLTDDLHWAYDPRRPLMRTAYYVNRDSVFRDVFTKIKFI